MTEFDHILEYLKEFGLNLENVEWNKPKNSQGSYFLVYVRLEKSIQTNPENLYANEVILKALNEGANPNTMNNQGKTALHLASSSYSIQHLIDFGAQVNVQDKEEKTALYYLIEDALHGVHNDYHFEKIKVLISNGAKLDANQIEQIKDYRYNEKLSPFVELANTIEEKNKLDQTISTMNVKAKMKL